MAARIALIAIAVVAVTAFVVLQLMAWSRCRRPQDKREETARCGPGRN